MYSVKLYEQNNQNMPYIINDIEADNENEAIDKAKEFVATYGYFPSMKKDKIKSLLVVDYVK